MMFSRSETFSMFVTFVHLLYIKYVDVVIITFDLLAACACSFSTCVICESPLSIYRFVSKLCDSSVTSDLLVSQYELC